MTTSKFTNVLKCRKIWIQVHVQFRSFSYIGHAETTLSIQRQPKSYNNILSLLQWAIPIARSFCEGCTWHHLHILVNAPLCCDWKGRAGSEQSFTLWHQATIKIPRHAHLISACSHQMGDVLHAHPVRGESHIHNNADWEATTLARRLDETLSNGWEWKRQVKVKLRKNLQ